MNLDTQVKLRKNYIEISNHRALVANKQGETGLVFRPETIRKAVDEYTVLINQAPYYRSMLDSHVKLSEAKHKDIAGLLTNVWVDQEGAARINYVVFNNTPVYDRLLVMAQLGGGGFISLSTRGFGEHVTIRPSMIRKTETQPVMLRDSPVKYFRVLGNNGERKSGIFLEGFILLGWDIVVAPSQNDASSVVFVKGKKAPPLTTTGVIMESSGDIRKAFGDISALKSELSDGKLGDLIAVGESASGPNTSIVGKPVEQLRTFIDAGGHPEYDEERSKAVRRLLAPWV